MDLTEGHFLHNSFKNIWKTLKASVSLCPVSANIHIQLKKSYVKKLELQYFDKIIFEIDCESVSLYDQRSSIYAGNLNRMPEGIPRLYIKSLFKKIHSSS